MYALKETHWLLSQRYNKTVLFMVEIIAKNT
jgi:hypothetical protein